MYHSTIRLNLTRGLTRIIIHNRYNSIIQTDSIRVAPLNTRMTIQPTQHLLMPDETIFWILDPTESVSTSLARSTFT